MKIPNSYRRSTGWRAVVEKIFLFLIMAVSLVNSVWVVTHFSN